MSRKLFRKLFRWFVAKNGLSDGLWQSLFAVFYKWQLLTVHFLELKAPGLLYAFEDSADSRGVSSQ